MKKRKTGKDIDAPEAWEKSSLVVRFLVQLFKVAR